MRCKNCGWENSDDSVRCVKCNAPLSGSMVDQGSGYQSSGPCSEPERPLSGTVKESSVFSTGGAITGQEPPSQSHETPSCAPSTCPRCGYPLRHDMNVCPSCGNAVKPTTAAQTPTGSDKCPKCGASVAHGENFCSKCGAPLKMGTVNSWLNPVQGVFCTLRPIAWTNEGIEHQPISYSGDSIVLSRSNTDPNNSSITSSEQAVLIHEGDDWFIENRSEQGTTFIQVRKRTKLETGDVIILGNRMFEFKG